MQKVPVPQPEVVQPHSMKTITFLEAPERTLTRAQLLQATRVHEDIFDRSIDVQILRLRRKLEVDTSTPRAIQTMRGVGYMLATRVEPF